MQSKVCKHRKININTTNGQKTANEMSMMAAWLLDDGQVT